MSLRLWVAVGAVTTAGVAGAMWLKAAPPAVEIGVASTDAIPVDARPPVRREEPAPVRPYDPMERVAAGVDPGDVFLQELRHPVWAPAVESVLGERMQRDLAALVPGTHLGVTCRTLSCLIQIDTAKDKVAAALAVVKLVMLGPLMAEVPSSQEGRAQVLFLSAPQMAEARAFHAWYVAAHSRMVAGIKSGAQPNPLPFPGARIPD